MDKTIGSLSKDDIQSLYDEYNLHIFDGEVKENEGIIVILDVIGWQNFANPQFVDNYFQMINRLRTELLTICKRSSAGNELKPNIRVVSMSDTIIVLINGERPYCDLNIFGHISKFITESLQAGIMFRGLINYGKYYTNTLDNAFIGETYYETVKSAEKTEWAGVILTDNLSRRLLSKFSIEELKALHIIRYEDIPFKEITPMVEKLVLTPFRDMKIMVDSGERIFFDFKKRYGELMNDGKKLENTIRFFDYLEKNFWNTNSSTVEFV